MLPPGGAGRNFYGVRPEGGPLRRAGEKNAAGMVSMLVKSGMHLTVLLKFV